MHEKPVICVGICTMTRPGLLAKCLNSLDAQTEVSDLIVHILVVDNDAQPSSKPVVDAFSATSPYPVHYHHEPRRGIPMARNRVLDEALALGANRIAFIDDDQVAKPTYLSGHMEAARRYAADAVQPHIIAIFPNPAPFWMTSQNDPEPNENKEFPDEGHTLKSAGTCGVMLDARLGRPDGLALRFDERLALAGGEDADFFQRAHALGAKIVWSVLPIVMEEAHPSRLTYSRYCMRGLARGGQLFGQYRNKHGYGPALKKYALTSVARAVRGVGQLLIAPLFLPFDMKRFKFTALEGGRNLFVAAGAVGGFFSLQYEYYRRIDGY